MQTNLGVEALNQLECFREFCTDEEFSTLENAIIKFDESLNGPEMEAEQAKEKLTVVSQMNFNGFSAIMYDYFKKTPSEYLNQAL